MATITVNGTPHTNGAHTNGLTNGDSHPTNGIHERVLSSYAKKFNLAPHFIGGNHLEAAPSSKVKNFVTAHDGHTVITNVGDESVISRES